jgi:hypothetical protein
MVQTGSGKRHKDIPAADHREKNGVLHPRIDDIPMTALALASYSVLQALSRPLRTSNTRL